MCLLCSCDDLRPRLVGNLEASKIVGTARRMGYVYYVLTRTWRSCDVETSSLKSGAEWIGHRSRAHAIREGRGGQSLTGGLASGGPGGPACRGSLYSQQQALQHDGREPRSTGHY